MPNKDHLFQLSVNCERNYPEYWAVKSSTNVGMGGYQQIIGNPDLKPSSSWNSQFVYMLKNKYILAAWFNYTDEYFIQTEYLHPERLNTIYKWLNFDFHYTAGIQVSIPFKAGKWLDTKPTLTGLYQHEKDPDFYDIPFDRGRFGVQARMNNNITISRKPNLLMNIVGNYHSGGIQGIMDIPQGGGLDMSLTWKFNKERASLKVGCSKLREFHHISIMAIRSLRTGILHTEVIMSHSHTALELIRRNRERMSIRAGSDKTSTVREFHADTARKSEGEISSCRQGFRYREFL